jgi:hypothetical protein
MAATVAADPELLARVRTDLAQVLPPLAAEAAALRDALGALRRARTWSGPWSSTPDLGPPVPPPVPPVPPALEQVIDEVSRSARYLVELVARSEQRFRAADRVRRLGTPLLRSLPRLAPPLVAALPSDPLTWLEQLLVDSSPAFLLLDHGAARSRAVGSGWWVVDAWQALEGGVGLARAVAPDAAWGARLLDEVPALRTLLADGGRVPLGALPVAGQAAALALTFGDVARVVGDGNPVTAARRDPLRYAGDVSQVGADVSSTACAVAPSVPTCGTALATNVLALGLQGWRRDDPLPFPVPPGILVVARPSDVEHLATRGQKVSTRAARRVVDGVAHRTHDTAHELVDAWHALPGLLR